MHACQDRSDIRFYEPDYLDVNFDPDKECGIYRVFLDEVEQFDCIVADSKFGYVIKNVLNSLGKPIKSNIGKNRFKTQKIHGQVRFQLK